MASRIIIHPGFPKSGTTALQASLMQAQADLVSQGLHFNPPWNNAHHRAAWAVSDYVFGWETNGGEKTPIEVWDKLVGEVKAASQAALISSEFLIHTDEQTVQRIRKDLGDAEYKIVFTIRAFAKVLPSRYQQSLKKGRTWTYEDWLRKVFSSDIKKLGLTDYAGTIKIWAKVFGAENVSVLIADESNPENLYRGFESAIGIGAGTLKPAKVKRLNRSLTASEVEILRQVNLRKPKKWKWRQYNAFVRGKFARHLSDHPTKFPDDPKLQLPDWAFEALEPYAKDQIDKLNKLGVSILGDVNVLYAKSRGANSVQAQHVPAEMAADLVLHLASIQSLEETSTRGLVREVFKRIRKRFS